MQNKENVRSSSRKTPPFVQQRNMRLILFFISNKENNFQNPLVLLLSVFNCNFVHLCIYWFIFHALLQHPRMSSHCWSQLFWARSAAMSIKSSWLLRVVWSHHTPLCLSSRTAASWRLSWMFWASCCCLWQLLIFVPASWKPLFLPGTILLAIELLGTREHWLR